MKYILTIFTLFLYLATPALSVGSRASIQTVAADPYRSAILINADSGEVLFEKNADTTVYPASSLKLMVLLVILEQIEQGHHKLSDMVQVTVEAYKMGGSQVYLDPKEQFSIEDLLYALMIQSANDAAVALATHVAGSKEAFIQLMNDKAKQLGMNNTTFHSVHGLPPSKGQEVDTSTARDFALLSRYMTTKPEVFPYTSTKVRDFRGGEFILRTHNHLLKEVPGCDGLKTGYFLKAGFSIAATAKRNGNRMIAIVMGSKNRKVRDAKATELLDMGFAMIQAKNKPAAPKKVVELPSSPASEQRSLAKTAPEQDNAAAKAATNDQTQSAGWGKFFMGVVFGFFLYALLDYIINSKKRKRSWRSK